MRGKKREGEKLHIVIRKKFVFLESAFSGYGAAFRERHDVDRLGSHRNVQAGFLLWFSSCSPWHNWQCRFLKLSYLWWVSTQRFRKVKGLWSFTLLASSSSVLVITSWNAVILRRIYKNKQSNRLLIPLSVWIFPMAYIFWLVICLSELLGEGKMNRNFCRFLQTLLTTVRQLI